MAKQRQDYFEVRSDGKVLARYLTSDSRKCYQIYRAVKTANKELDFNNLEALFLGECKKQKVKVDIFNNADIYATATLYQITLKSKAWVLLNTIWRYVNYETDYRATPKKYLNIGESMITELEIYYFRKGGDATEFSHTLLNKFNYDHKEVDVVIESIEI